MYAFQIFDCQALLVVFPIFVLLVQTRIALITVLAASLSRGKQVVLKPRPKKKPYRQCAEAQLKAF